MKYALLGHEKDPRNPSIFGVSPKAVAAVIEYRMAIFVEGYYDTLACRILAPELPFLSSGSKNLNDRQVWYCRIAGANTIRLMFDRDEKDTEDGAGIKAMAYLSDQMSLKHPIIMETLDRPLGAADDPSDALKRYEIAEKLRSDFAARFRLTSFEEPVNLEI
jgi:hypothetical protein